MGRFGEALNVSTNAFAKDSSIDNSLGLALAYYYNNRSSEALEKIKKAATLCEKDEWLLITYTKINLYAGEHKTAILAFENTRLFDGSIYILLF